MKMFHVDCYARLTEALSSSVSLWHVLQAFFSMCAHKLKEREFKSGDCRGKKF